MRTIFNKLPISCDKSFSYKWKTSVIIIILVFFIRNFAVCTDLCSRGCVARLLSPLNNKTILTLISFIFLRRYPDGTVKLRNPNIELMDQDILYHLALGSESHDLVEMFGDVKVN